MEIFDEDKAVEFIKAKLKEVDSVSRNYESDDILEVIDIIWDFYEDNGLLDLDMSDSSSAEEEVDIEAVISHVKKMIQKDKSSNVDINDIPAIVRAEIEYEKSLED